MKIDSIVHKNETMASVSFESGEKLIISKEIIYREGLRGGDTLSEAFYTRLLEEDEQYRTLQSAYRFLARRPHSVFELKGKLMRKKFQNPFIDAAVSKLLELGFLNDYEFACSYTAERIQLKKIGEMRVKAELFKRGVAREIIEQVFDEHNFSHASEANIKDIAEKKYALLKQRYTDSRKLQQKLYAYLQSKGYPFEQIREVTENIIDIDESIQ